MIHTRIRFLILIVLLPICPYLNGLLYYHLKRNTCRRHRFGHFRETPRPICSASTCPFPCPRRPSLTYEGSRLYGELDAGLSIAVYTTRVDIKTMATDLQLKEDEAVRHHLNGTIETASKAVLSQINAEDISTSQEETTFQGLPAIIQTATFTREKKSMRARLLGFSDGP